MALILIVDDNQALRAVLKQALEAAGHVAAQAGSGRAAIQLIRLQRPDLVLTDLMMPEQDGLEVIMMIQKEFPEIPVIAMSGGTRNSSLYLDMAKKLGARQILAKPFMPDQLFAAIKDALGR